MSQFQKHAWGSGDVCRNGVGRGVFHCFFLFHGISVVFTSPYLLSILTLLWGVVTSFASLAPATLDIVLMYLSLLHYTTNCLCLVLHTRGRFPLFPRTKTTQKNQQKHLPNNKFDSEFWVLDLRLKLMCVFERELDGPKNTNVVDTNFF